MGRRGCEPPCLPPSVQGIPVADRAESRAVSGGQNLLTDVPMMAVPPFGHALLREGDVCCDRAVKKMEWMGFDDGTNSRREQVERSQHTLSQSDMCPGAPSPKRLRMQENPGQSYPKGGGGLHALSGASPAIASSTSSSASESSSPSRGSGSCASPPGPAPATLPPMV